MFSDKTRLRVVQSVQVDVIVFIVDRMGCVVLMILHGRIVFVCFFVLLDGAVYPFFGLVDRGYVAVRIAEGALKLDHLRITHTSTAVVE